MSLPLRDEDLHTYADYRTWPEAVRYELIDGRAYCMAGPDLNHQILVGELYAQLHAQLRGTPCRALVAPFDVCLPKQSEADDAIDTVVQPDVFVVCKPDRLSARFVRGAPDLVIEVLSPTTAGHDHVVKRRVYEHAGVSEYWLVHPVDRIVTIYRLESEVYGRPDVAELSGVTAVQILPGVEIDWDDAVSRLLPMDA